VLLSASSLDFRQEAVVDLCESVVGRGVPLRCVQAGDKLKLDDTVALEILHPEGGFRDSEDNANSVVLRVEYAGRRLLLTGDLEGAGLACLLEQSPQAVDVLMSPHHGSRVANPPALGEWATPRHVVTSTAEADAVVQLRDRYAEEVTLWSTANSGAVEVTISPQGDLRVTPFVR
jgi:competence protein ComEC